MTESTGKKNQPAIAACRDKFSPSYISEIPLFPERQSDANSTRGSQKRDDCDIMKATRGA